MNEKIEKRQQQLEQKAENSDNVERVGQAGSIPIYRTVHDRGDRITVYFTSGIHWTYDAVTVQQKSPGDYRINYSSGGTHGANAAQVARVMSEIFHLAEHTLNEMENGIFES